jgi:Spy/CpxP family protein refolding chaperone
MTQFVRRYTQVAAALAALGFGAVAAADPPGGGMHGMMGGDGPMAGETQSVGRGPARPHFHALWQLGLSDEQRVKVDAVHDELHKKHLELMGRMHDQQTRLRDLYAVQPYDAGKIGAAYGEMGKLRAQMVEAEVDALNRGVALLDPEQKARFKELASAPPSAAGCGGMMRHGPGMHRGPAGGKGTTMPSVACAPRLDPIGVGPPPNPVP